MWTSLNHQSDDLRAFSPCLQRSFWCPQTPSITGNVSRCQQLFLVFTVLQVVQPSHAMSLFTRFRHVSKPLKSIIPVLRCVSKVRAFNLLNQLQPIQCLSNVTLWSSFSSELGWFLRFFPPFPCFVPWIIWIQWRLPVELEEDLSEWRDAAAEFLRAACGVSDRCVIVTNSKPPWAPRMGRGRR